MADIRAPTPETPAAHATSAIARTPFLSPRAVDDRDQFSTCLNLGCKPTAQVLLEHPRSAKCKVKIASLAAHSGLGGAAADGTADEPDSLDPLVSAGTPPPPGCFAAGTCSPMPLKIAARASALRSLSLIE